MSLKRSANKGQRGFTLLELLFVLTIIALLVATIVPNLITFFGVANLKAARTEAETVRTAALAYYGTYSVWPGDSTDLTAFLSSRPKATYMFDATFGTVKGVSNVTWSGVTWSSQDATWVKG